MKKLAVLSLAMLIASALAVEAQQIPNVPPPWAYGYISPPPEKVEVQVRTPAAKRDETAKHTAPGSSQSFTEAQAQAR